MRLARRFPYTPNTGFSPFKIDGSREKPLLLGAFFTDRIAVVAFPAPGSFFVLRFFDGVLSCAHWDSSIREVY